MPNPITITIKKEFYKKKTHRSTKKLMSNTFTKKRNK